MNHIAAIHVVTGHHDSLIRKEQVVDDRTCKLLQLIRRETSQQFCSPSSCLARISGTYHQSRTV